MAQCEQYLPHVLACLRLLEKEGETLLEMVQLLNRAGAYLKGRIRYSEAEPLLQQALALNEKLLGADHLETATSLNNLAVLYVGQARHAEAEPLLQRALAIREKQAGPEHPDTRSTFAQLKKLQAGRD